MTVSPQELKDNNQVASLQWQYWISQYGDAQVDAQRAWATALAAADNFQQLLLLFLNVIPDCMNQVGALLGANGAALNYAGSIGKYASSMQSFFNMKDKLSNDDALQYITEMQDMYHILQDPNSPLSDNDRKSLLDMLTSLSTAYGRTFPESDPNATYTPMDINADTLIYAQTRWKPSDTGATPQIDGNFTAASDAFQQINTQCTSINNTLTYQQKFWADMMNQFQSVFKEFDDYYTNVNSFTVNSTKSV